ncbi:uncharacterized protein EKO05_0003937 [Ascochyta rabiei]|uniref:Zinc ion binding n=1 Tax=Didymella rabiei TaxID=5454 RepID=A0A163DX78_DIDRA|nr:uncharacterized protein EKO05_0003937 [Ascochyta rabiei]KZM23397.1 zinc ion binding [Ascochyta rabiei]UPX13429.1 hypothetical protein EKO05_0003937 [Ascochyta rabiei]
MRLSSATNISLRTLADAALTCLSPSSEPAIPSPTDSISIVSARSVAPASTTKKALSNIYTDQSTDPSAEIVTKPRIKPEIEITSRSLPSLLQYVDHVLLRDTSSHNQPPHPGQKCVICNLQWDKASVPSTFLPLSSCNHWVHYRCLIWLATGDGPHRDKCYACNKPLYEWDGISALTLATRTSLPMSDSRAPTSTPNTHVAGTSDKDAYEQECMFIDNTIAHRFFDQLGKPAGFSDGSPDLVQCYDDVLNDLSSMGRPHSKWLRWSTSTGCLLFSMLVAIKMKRFLLEGHGRIVQTEAWTAWEDGCRSLQRRILENVHSE